MTLTERRFADPEPRRRVILAWRKGFPLPQAIAALRTALGACRFADVEFLDGTWIGTGFCGAPPGRAYFSRATRKPEAGMAEGEYQVVFRGELVGDRPEQTVKQQLAALFKMPAAKVEALFSGKPVVVKRNLDQATARKFEAAFRKTGAVCELRGPQGAESGAAPAAAPESAAADPRPAPAAREGAPAGGGGERRGSMAAAGDPNQTLLDVEVPASLEGLEVDESDAPLAPPDAAPAPEIDTSGLGVADNGGDLSEHKPQSPPDIDISGLSLEDPER